jgi:restriction endonuclease S subunit
LGMVAVAEEWLLPANMNRDVAIIKMKKAKILSEYLGAFLMSKYGQFQLIREGSGGVQQMITLGRLSEIRVPLLSQNIQAGIADAFRKAKHERDKAKDLYFKAERLLLAELSLWDLDLSPALFYDRSLSEVFAAGRFDAEHFQPKFSRVLEALQRSSPIRISCLGDFLEIITNGHTPRNHDFSVGEVPFLMAEHVSDFNIDYSTDKYILTEQHQGELKRTRLEEGDILVTIKGRIGNAAVVEGLPKSVNINQDIARIRLNHNIPSYFLVAFVNSPAGKAFVEQYCTGQINPFLSLTNLRLIPIPVYEQSRMESIAEKAEELVRSARQACSESNLLLQKAKQMVEEAVSGGGS